MSIAVIDTRMYALVESYTEDTDVYVPPDGSIVYINEIGGNAAYNSNIHVKVSFGGSILFATHGDAIHHTDLTLVGDGVSELKISLKNDSATSETIGAYYIGRQA